ncbi:MAG: DUF4912 domain-containing protein [Candidatus Omnitrophica bacterium]|nr:DUF4912 domain-containing protein [Candidatus Omnitrophota bacterium]MDD5553603.1 DUF4912 domain-containing protein [Candidatus Omnitrophota bacterium]
MAILRGIKQKLKDLKGRNKKNKPAKSPLLRKRIEAKEQPKEEKTRIHGQQETAVEKTKFYTPEPVKPAPARVMPQELPGEYGSDKIVLQVRDPRWLHTYWEVTPKTYEGLKEKYREAFYGSRRVLRVYDVSNIIFNGNNAHSFFDIQVNEGANSWYIQAGDGGRSWCVDLGLLLPDGTFVTIVRSNTVSTPSDGPSHITDEEWMIPEEIFARLYGMGFGLGKSSPVGKAWQERVKRELFSGVLSSPGISSPSSPVKKIPGEKKFWMVVNTELIVYGATEPDASVFIQDRQVNLRPDGTFTMRFALPDGKQVIPVKAVSSDLQEERTIIPVVNKETR